MFELLGNVGGLMESTRLTAEEDAFMESFDGYICPYDDADEATLYAAMESQQNFNNLMQAVALQEMNYYMTHGEEMVYEAVDFKGFFGKIKEVILKAWEKIKGIFKKVFDTINGWIRTDANYIKKYEKDMKEADDTPIDFNGYAVNLKFSPFDYILDGVDSIELDIGKGNVNVEKDDDKIESAFIKIISNDHAKNKEEYLNWVKKEFGIDTKITINKYDANLCITEIRDAKISKKIAKESYDSCKRLWSGLAKSCDVARDMAIKELRQAGDSSKEKEKNITTAAGIFSKKCNMVNRLSHSALNINTKAIKIAHDQAKSMTAKAIAVKKKEKAEKKSSNESFTGYMDFDLV